MSEIKIDNLSYSFKKNDINVLNNLNAIFGNEQISVIVGPSGCGKSTLLRCIAGLYNYKGSIYFDDICVDNLPTQKRDIAFVNQNYSLYPHLNIFDSISFPLKIAKAPIQEIRQSVYKISEELGIKNILTRKPNQISGGQAQRAALARALIKRSNIILFDEPLSNVDENFRAEFRLMIKELCHKHKATAVYVTHDLTEAISIGDKIYLMINGEIVFSGTGKEIMDTDNKQVREFFIKDEIRL